ncbi:bifunctional 5,10-methylenetetrahydrofolate dehydrogenase/5,10-methenyltetrahydrofolate cyclohydrolase [Candidatus Micrarchaeota archaeon]|nr:bifunctional 5,10-methylenetetrahydrofolate dehydrogenase/5,10-methenyltetrahydrofolate cyclohydrolase [Candidatus Micrarchaeota archaeon]
MILSGKEPAEKILEKCRNTAKKLNIKPVLAVVLVGDDPASHIYVNKKKKTAEKYGVETRVHIMPENTPEPELLKLVEKLNKDNTIDGFIVQLPLPRHINQNKVIEAIDPKKDVDGFHPINIGKVFLDIIDEKTFIPATPYGIIELLNYYSVPIEGKKAVVIGRSTIVGKPVAALLLNKNATVTICHSRTKNLKKQIKDADIVVVAVGKPEMINGSMVKKGSYIIDAGTSRIEGKIVGDVNFESVKLKGAHCTPNPGGVGPMTIAMLLKNTFKAAEIRGLQ